MSFVNTCQKNQQNGELNFGALRIQKGGICGRLRFIVEPIRGFLGSIGLKG